jgi:hypothetical protein
MCGDFKVISANMNFVDGTLITAISRDRERDREKEMEREREKRVDLTA